MMLRLLGYVTIALFAGFGLNSVPQEGEKPLYPNRWVRIQSSLRSDEELEKVSELVRRGAAHGINGIAFSAGLDTLDLKPPDYFERLKKLREVCRQHGVDIVPSFWSAGYGGGILAHDKNLAAGLPVRDALFRVGSGEAVLEPDPEAKLVNGDFEVTETERLPGFVLDGKLGEIVSRDIEVFKEGSAALRFSNFSQYEKQASRIRQVVRVIPYRHYRISAWVRAQGLDASEPFGSGNFRIEVLGSADARRLQFENPRYKQDGEWHRVAVGFNSWGYEAVEIVPVVSNTGKGSLWLDDLRLEEIALVNVLRRPGTPVVVKSASEGTTYEEGKDYAPIADPVMNFRVDHEGPVIKPLPGSRIRDGERLKVSFYHSAFIYNDQIPICMSEPKVYEIWRTQARLVHEALAPRKYLLNMDEVRVGGSCEACKSRGMTNAQILGDSVTQQYSILKAVNPEAEIFIWSDMLDPNHNANPERLHYYLAEQNFAGSWNYVPKDLTIVCWYHAIREKSLKHFSGLGFRTMAGAYYDADDLANCRSWLESLDRTQGAVGIMYTTWLRKYDLLESFGDLVARR